MESRVDRYNRALKSGNSGDKTSAKCHMMLNGAVSTRNPTSSPGRYAGMDNGWSISLLDTQFTEFNKSIVKYPNIKHFPGGA